jgi:DNA-binding LytR/AlgR family response regulator
MPEKIWKGPYFEHLYSRMNPPTNIRFKILIVEDEFIIGQHLKELLEGFAYETRHALDAEEALQTLKDFRADLALLDINLSGTLDGIALAEKIKEQFEMPIVFLTSHSDPDTLQRAKKVRPAAYLTKPFKKDDLYTTAEIALSNFAESTSDSPAVRQPGEEANVPIIKEAVFVKHNRVLTKVEFKEITYLKSDRVYLEIHRKGRPKLVIRESLNKFGEVLGDQFYRIHRSYVVNLTYLETIGTDDVVVDGQELPIGKPYRDELLSRIRN